MLTVVAWCIPLLTFPQSLLSALGFPVLTPLLFARLLGMAYVALVVGYVFGLRDAQHGQYPAGVVWVGLASNGGACAIMAAGAMTGAWSSWGVLARWFMWMSMAGTAAITVALAVFGPCWQVGRTLRDPS